MDNASSEGHRLKEEVGLSKWWGVVHVEQSVSWLEQVCIRVTKRYGCVCVNVFQSFH